jgi:thioredoxin-related protein
MRQSYLLVTFLACFGIAASFNSLYAQSLQGNDGYVNEIDFYESQNQVHSVASTFNMPILLYIYDGYSQACADIERIVFADKEVANFYNNNLVCYKLNINSAEGMKYYSYAKSRPAFVYFNSQLEVIKSASGFKDKDSFLQLGKDAIASNTLRDNPMDVKYTKFLSDKNTYDNFVRSKDFLGEYIYELKDFNEPYSNVLQEYTKLHDFSITSPDCAKLILDFAEDIHGDPFMILMNDKQHFVSMFGKQTVDQKINNAFRAAAVNAANDRSRHQLEDAIKLIPKAKLSDGTLLAYSLKALYFETVKDWNSYAATIDEYTKNTAEIDDAFLDKAARLYTFAVDDETKLKNAERWVEQALAIKASRHRTLETQAIVQYKLGKKSKALKTIDTAIETAKKQRIDYSTAFRIAEDIRANRALSAKYKN